MQFELGDRADVAAVDGAAPTAEAQAAAVPAFGDRHTEDVVACTQQVGEVVRLVAEAVAVDGPAGSEDVVADRHAVAADGVHAVRRGVEPGPRQTGIDGERATEPDRSLRRHTVEVGRHGHRRPVGGIEQADLDVERIAPRRVVAVAAGDADGDAPALA